MSVLPTEFLQRLGYAVCEEGGSDKFVLLSDPPPWFQEIWGKAAAGDLLALADRSPYLEAFLSEAEEHWASTAETPIDSGSWIERGSSNREFPLEARAWRLNGRRILSIQSAENEFQEQVRVLQTARDSLLAHERLLKEIQSKEILLHCIIHDLSQPLTAMRGCFDILAQENSTPGSKRLIALGRQQSERQDAMIREILQAFAADINSSMGAESAQAGPNILACAEETVTAFGPIFQSHGAEIHLHSKVDRDAPWAVVGEKSRLLRVFSNLVENALRHAPKGSAVTIGLEDDGTHIKASVNDEGPGLPKDFRPSEAFALFSKGKQGGGKAGLGLYFCRITVERWGGSIACESLPGRGARFWFRLPKAAHLESAHVSLRVSARTSTFRRHLRILLAEDDPAIRELTGVMLERERHEVVAVSSGSKALRAVASRRFDLMLLDEEMPGIGGVAVTKEIRSRESVGGKRQTIFALTGNSTEEDRARLLAAGFDACLAKPFRAEELRQAIAHFFPGTAGAPPRENKDKKRPDDTSASAPPPDPSLLARVGGDMKLLQSIIKTFLNDYRGKLRKVKQAVTRQDAPALASSAHSIKGAVAIFGAADAVESASDLERMGRQNNLETASIAFGRLDKAIARLDAKLREYVAPARRNRPRAKRDPHRSR